MAAANLAAAQEYTNLALDKPTSQSQTKYGGVSSRAVDGNTDGNWGGGSVTHTPENVANPWWEVDLQGSHEISKINIFGRTDCCQNRLQRMVVTVFNGDEEVWSYVQGNQTPPNTLVLDVEVEGSDTDFVIGSKVRVSLPNSGTISLAEVQVLKLFIPTNVPSTSPSTSQAPTSSCPHTFVVSSVECTANAFENAAPGTCQLSDISERYGLESAEMNNLIGAYCEDAEPGLNFTYVTTEAGNPRNFQWDNNYFDGATLWNLENTLNEDGDSIRRTWEIHEQTRIAWPNLEGSYEDDNFQNCDARAVMCCFTDNHQEELSTNAKVCYHDMEDSATSNHIKAGWTLFDSESEGAYCKAFSWHDDEEHMSARYRGNALFYTSMYSLYDEGYAGNIPSAPMCACIEQMPVVTKPECVSVVADDESYELSFTPDAISVRLAASVTYGNCGDFIDHYATMATDEEVTDLQNKIVEECDEPRREYLNDKFLVRGTPAEEYPVDTNTWDIVVGKGKYYFPAKGETFLRNGVASDPNKILYRYCLDCTGTHKHIFYKRLTDIPSELQFLDLFMDNWFDTHNVLGVDFNLYSTYEDAVADENPWTFCNYNDAQIGFPRDCGPTGYKAHQWNRFYNGSGQNNVAYYVKKVSADAQRGGIA